MKTLQHSGKIVSAILLSVFAFAGSPTANAQVGKINAGLELGIPLGSFSNGAGLGIGVSAKYENTIASVRNLNWTAGVGFLSFRGKENYVGPNVHFGMVPIQGGIKYYGTDRFAGFYGSAELGFTVLSASVSDRNNYYVYPSTTYVSFAPGVGYQYENFDFSGRFQLLDGASYFSLRAAYVFDLAARR